MRVDAAHPSDFDPVRMEPHRIEDTVCRTDDGVEKFSLDPKSPYDIIKTRGNRKTVSHTLQGSVGISLKGGGWYDGLHFRCDLSPDPVQDSAGNKITAFHFVAEGSYQNSIG